VPILRVRRDGRLISKLARTRPRDALQLSHWQPTNRRDLVEACESGLLHDPGTEPFVARHRLRRQAGDIEYSASVFLYSHHQVMLVPTLKAALPYLRIRKTGRRTRAWFDVHPFFRDGWFVRGQQIRDLAIACSALEPVYFPEVTRRLSLPSEMDFSEYDRWRRQLKVTGLLKWLAVDAGWVRDAGAFLLHLADNVDPLGDWINVVREADPERWQKLKGDARSAIDLRIGAELLLRYHDRLVRARRATPIKAPEGRWRSDFDSRLKPRGQLDRVLTDFGLSPHPSLVLVVEGATELLLFPRVMERFGIRTDDDFIAIQDAEGVSKDLSPLLSYAIAPRVESAEDGRYLRLHRPLTRILVVTDAEGPMTTSAMRDKQRQKWVDRLWRALPSAHRTDAVRSSLDRLVYIDTWTTGGLSFEFAHFTDLELARALARLDHRRRGPSVQRWRQLASDCRRRHGNLKEIFGWGSKVALADELWPVLDAKITKAEKRGTETRIPIVRVVDRATDLARELPRRNIVIPLG
jgi:hypothetical protein